MVDEWLECPKCQQTLVMHVQVKGLMSGQPIWIYPNNCLTYSEAFSEQKKRGQMTIPASIPPAPSEAKVANFARSVANEIRTTLKEGLRGEYETLGLEAIAKALTDCADTIDALRNTPSDAAIAKAADCENCGAPCNEHWCHNTAGSMLFKAGA